MTYTYCTPNGCIIEKAFKIRIEKFFTAPPVKNKLEKETPLQQLSQNEKLLRDNILYCLTALDVYKYHRVAEELITKNPQPSLSLEMENSLRKRTEKKPANLRKNAQRSRKKAQEVKINFIGKKNIGRKDACAEAHMPNTGQGPVPYGDAAPATNKLVPLGEAIQELQPVAAKLVPGAFRDTGSGYVVLPPEAYLSLTEQKAKPMNIPPSKAKQFLPKKEFWNKKRAIDKQMAKAEEGLVMASQEVRDTIGLGPELAATKVLGSFRTYRAKVESMFYDKFDLITELDKEKPIRKKRLPEEAQKKKADNSRTKNFEALTSPVRNIVEDQIEVVSTNTISTSYQEPKSLFRKVGDFVFS